MKRFFTICLAMAISVLTLAARDYGFENGILYKTERDAYSDEMCKLDVAFERGGENRPVIVWFHGGGLTGGHRGILRSIWPDSLEKKRTGSPF